MSAKANAWSPGFICPRIIAQVPLPEGLARFAHLPPEWISRSGSASDELPRFLFGLLPYTIKAPRRRPRLFGGSAGESQYRLNPFVCRERAERTQLAFPANALGMAVGGLDACDVVA